MEQPADPGAPDADARLAARAGRLRLLVAGLAGRAVRARHDVEDLVQDVYLRALADRARWPEDERAFDAHLSLLARHVVVEAARRMRAAKREGDAGARPLAGGANSAGTDFASALGAHSPGPRTQAAARELSGDLVASFLRLAPEHRRVLTLRQFQGLAAAECARRMGRSEVAVHSLYRRALEAWGRELGGEPIP